MSTDAVICLIAVERATFLSRFNSYRSEKTREKTVRLEKECFFTKNIEI